MGPACGQPLRGPGRVEATGIAITGNFVGAVCGPLLFGLLAEAAGYPWAWGFTAITSAAAAVVMAAAGRLTERGRR